MTFAGIPPRAEATAIPNVIFTDVLPLLADDPAGAAVAIYSFLTLQRKRGFPRYLTRGDFEADPSLAAYLRGAGVTPAAIPRALRRAAEAGLFLTLAVEADGRTVDLYFLNTPSDRRGLQAVRAGAVDVGRVVQRELPVERPGIFALYEAEIGTVTPALADELTEAEQLYPADWLEAAFREAAAQNARSWRYVSRILERWATEGPDHAKTERNPGSDGRYLDGRYGRLLKQRLQP